MLTRADLAAIRAILETRYGWHHPLTQRVHQAWQAAPPEPTHHDEEGGAENDASELVRP